jgi:aminopeptidase N
MQAAKSLKWIIRPVRPIPANQSVLLRFSYTGGEQLANQFYISSEVSFASAWGTDWYPVVDGENDKGIGSLRFSVPAGQTVYAAGNLRSSAQETEQGIFKFEIVHPTYFAFAAGNYTVVRRDASIPVAAYLLKPRQNMEQYLDGVSKILNVLTQEFGSYPFGEFALVEIPRELAQKAGFNAAAMQGFILINSRAFDAPDVKYVLNFFGHEFSHQWFPHTIALKTPPGLYMEEALAEYGALRVVETLAGADAAAQYRRTGFEYDPGYSALQYFKLVGAGFDNKLSDLQPKLEHRNIAYSKGFLVFDMLSREIGRERFQRILHNLTRRSAFREIRWNEFLRAFETGAGRNLRWFYEQWFERSRRAGFRADVETRKTENCAALLLKHRLIIKPRWKSKLKTIKVGVLFAR